LSQKNNDEFWTAFDALIRKHLRHVPQDFKYPNMDGVREGAHFRYAQEILELLCHNEKRCLMNDILRELHTLNELGGK